MVTTHSTLTTSWVGETTSRKADIDVQIIDPCFLPWQNRLEACCSCKPPNHRPQHVCEWQALFPGQEKPGKKSLGKIRQDTFFQLRYLVTIFPTKKLKKLTNICSYFSRSQHKKCVWCFVQISGEVLWSTRNIDNRCFHGFPQKCPSLYP